MALLSKLAGAGKGTLLLARAVLLRTAGVANRLRKGLGSSGVLSLQAVLLAGNVLFFTAGLKARKRAQFAAAVRCITDLDEDGLRLVLGYIPAWVKFSEYERARFLNSSLLLLWPAFDRAICNLLKAELEPLLQANAPSAVAGCHFDSLSFGSSAIQIVGIKNSTFRTGADQLGIVLDIDVRWAGQPDITLKLQPSSKWMIKQTKIGKVKLLPQIDFTPEMHIAFNTLHVAGMLRVTLTPIMQDVPFVGGVSLSWLEMPMIDFDVKGLGGADLMSMPAIADWIMQSVVQGFLREMVWPKQYNIGFVGEDDMEQWQAPLGVVTVEVLEARLPPRVHTISRKEKPLHPYAALVVGDAGTSVESEHGPNVQSATTSTQWNTVAPAWSEKFHLCVYDSAQVLKLVMAHNMETGSPQNDLTLGRVDIPLKMLAAPVENAKQLRLSGSVLAASQARRALGRARRRTHGSLASSVAGDSPRSGGGEGVEAGGPSGGELRRDSSCRSLPGGRSDDDAETPRGASPRALEHSGASDGAGSWAMVGHGGSSPGKGVGLPADGGAGAAAASVSGDDPAVDEILSIMAPTQQHDFMHGPEAAHAEAQARMLLRPPSPVQSSNGAGLLGVLDFRSFTAAGASGAWAGSGAKPPLKQRHKATKHRNHVAHEAALAAASAEGAWLPLLSMKNAAGGLQSWDPNTAPDTRPELRTRSTFGASYFPSLAHISTLLGGATRSAPEQPATLATASVSASDTAHASNRAAEQQMSSDDAPSGSELASPAAAGAAEAAGDDVAAAAPSSHFFSSSFWDWHQASRRMRPPNKVANRLVTWATGSAHASSVAEPLTALADGKAIGQADSHKHGADGGVAAVSGSAIGSPPAAAAPLQGSSAASTPRLDAAAGNNGGSGSATAQGAKTEPAGSRRASAPTAPVAKPAVVSTGSRWRRRSLEGRPAGHSPKAATMPAGSEISTEDQAQLATFAEALDAGDSQARAYSRKAEVLGLARVRLTFRPLADESAAAAVLQQGPAPPGQQVGVLLVRLCSAALSTGAELTHPAVRLTIGKQVRQTTQYATLHGGRVTWDATCFAFAMAVHPDAPTEVSIQVGNLSASLGDRLWATWFSSAAQYARATQPLAVTKINVQKAIRDGRMAGTWEMGADGLAGADTAGEVAGQITMRMSWRPVVPA